MPVRAAEERGRQHTQLQRERWRRDRVRRVRRARTRVGGSGGRDALDRAELGAAEGAALKAVDERGEAAGAGGDDDVE